MSDPQPQDVLAEHDICNQPLGRLESLPTMDMIALISKIFAGELQMMKSISSYSALSSVGFQIIAVSFQTKYDVIGMYMNI